MGKQKLPEAPAQPRAANPANGLDCAAARSADAESNPCRVHNGDSGECYRAVIETSADGFAVTDSQGRFLEVNEVYLKRSGYSREELLKMRVVDLEARETPEEVGARIAQIIRDGNGIFEGLHRAKDGTLWPVEVNTSYWPIDDGRFFVFFRDLLGRKRSEALLAARARLSELADGVDLDKLMQATIDEAEIFTGSRIGFFHFVNQDQESLALQAWSSNTLSRMCSAEGKGMHYPISKAGVWVDCFHRRKPVIHQDYEALTEKKGLPPGHAPVTRELTVPIIRGGKVKAIIGVGNKTSDYTDDDVQVVSELASLAIDLVERKQAEEALRRREERLQQALTAAQQGWFDLNVQTGEVKASPEYARMLGYDEPPYRSTVQNWLDNLHPEDREGVQAAFRQLLTSGETSSLVYRRRTKNGQWKWIRSTGRIIERDENGQPLRITGTHTDISELKDKEEQARAWGEKFEAVFSLSPNPMTITEIDSGRIIDLNDAAAGWFGRTRREALGLTTAEVQVWPDPEDRRRMVRMIKEQGEIEALPLILARYGGELRHVLFSSRFLDYEGRRVLLSSTQDITPIIQAEEALRQSEERYRNIVEKQLEYVDRYLPGGTLTYVNEALVKVTDLPAEQLLGTSFFNFIHPDDRQELLDSIAALDREHPTVVLENRVMLPNGNERWQQWSHMALFDDRGKIVEYQSVGRDITKRKKAENDLRRREQQLRYLGDNLPDGLIYRLVVEPGGRSRFEYVSEGLEELFQLKEDEVLIDASGLYERLHPDDREAALAAQAVSAENLSPFRYECRFVLPDGKVRWIRWHAMPERTPDGGVVWNGMALDLTERKKAEEEMRRNEEFIRAIHDSMDEGLIVVDRDFRVISANRAYCQQVGKTQEELADTNCYEHTHRSTGPCLNQGVDCTVKQVFDSGVPQTATVKYSSEDGQHYLEVKAYPLKNANGDVTAAIKVLNDITERHQLEVEQLKTQKLEAIGTLAGGIAHDFNNLLQGVFGYLSLAKHALDTPKKAAELLAQGEEALSLAVNLTTQLLTFAKGGKPVIKPAQLGPVIENASKFALSGSSCKGRYRLAEDLWPAEVDEGQIAQVIQNIVLNATEAMPNGGYIQIGADNVSLEPGESANFPEGGKFLRIVVRDNGIGIPEKYLARIFDPYFTTKQKGSGLGLATSYSIVKNHGGTIEVDSSQGQGTTFAVCLPARESLVATAQVAEEPAAAGKARILVMDDEQMVRNIAGRMLKLIGHEAVCEADGESTIDRYSRELAAGMRFDLVILDLTIKGGMGGEETIGKLLELDPEAKVVVSSGYSDSPVVSNFREYGFAAVLSKPYSIGDLKKCLNELLAE